MKRLMTAEEVAEFLQVSPHTVWRWIREEKLPAISISPRTYRIREEDLEAFLEERKTTGSHNSA